MSTAEVTVSLSGLRRALGQVTPWAGAEDWALVQLADATTDQAKPQVALSASNSVNAGITSTITTHVRVDNPETDDVVDVALAQGWRGPKEAVLFTPHWAGVLLSVFKPATKKQRDFVGDGAVRIDVDSMDVTFTDVTGLFDEASVTVPRVQRDEWDGEWTPPDHLFDQWGQLSCYTDTTRLTAGWWTLAARLAKSDGLIVATRSGLIPVDDKHVDDVRMTHFTGVGARAVIRSSSVRRETVDLTAAEVEAVIDVMDFRLPDTINVDDDGKVMYLFDQGGEES